MAGMISAAPLGLPAFLSWGTNRPDGLPFGIRLAGAMAWPAQLIGP
jgi:hypothetical protein